MTGQRGAALLVVLWVVGVLGVLLGGLVTAVQLQQRLARLQGDQTQAAFAAQAGVELAVANALRNDRARWLPDGQAHTLHFAGSTLRVSLTSERGKLDLNACSPTSLAKLLRASGATEQATSSVTQALLARRNEVPLRMPEEFRSLPGMTQAVYDRALPSITVWAGTPLPATGLASPRLAAVLGLPSPRGTAPEPGPVLTVTSEARLANGSTSRLQVTLILRPAYAGNKPYRLLRRQE